MPSKIEHRKLTDLHPLEGNPRTISDIDMARLVESIRKFGVMEGRPLLLSDRTGKLVVIAGNQRLKAAAKLGLEEVPTFLLSGLTEQDEREIVIRDNVSNGDWDEAALQKDWVASDLAEWGVDVSGWDKVDPNAEWNGMPEFKQDDKTAFRQIIVSFDSQANVDAFAQLIGQNITDKTRSLWHPAQIRMETESKRYAVQPE